MPPNSSDRTVSARAVLDNLLRVQRVGSATAMKQLEAAEPDLAEYVFEALASVYRQLLALGAPARKTRGLYAQLETLVMVSILAALSAKRPSRRTTNRRR
jgi:hypothetical protein